MYCCGWDGGGTKTALCAMDRASGAVIGEAEFGPLNPNGIELDKVKSTIRDALNFMDTKLPGGLAGCEALTIGMAGYSNRDSVQLIERFMREAGYAGQLRLTGDQTIALNGAIQGPGAVIIAGTGSVCCGRDAEGRIYRTGGYGHLIDDPGSGFALGRDILAAAVRAEDGRIPDTVLLKLVYQRVGVVDSDALMRWLYAPATGKKDIAALAPLLLEALAQGDQEAYNIARRAADELALLAGSMWKKASLGADELAMAGGIFRHYPVIRERFIALMTERVPGIRIHDPLHSPAYGAARMAMESSL